MTSQDVPTQGQAQDQAPDGDAEGAPFPPPIAFTQPWEYEFHLPRDPRGPGVARSALRAVLAAHGLGEVAYRAELLTSELVTNAVRYAPGSSVVRLRWSHPELRVSVLDNCPSLPAPLRRGGTHPERGRGLLLLDLLADDWGGRPLDTAPFGGAVGKSVWFALTVGSAGGDPRAV